MIRGSRARTVAGDDLPVQDHVREARVFGPFQRLVQFGGLISEHRDDGSAGTGVTRGYQDDGCEEGAGAARSAAMACLVHRRLAR